MEEVEEYLQSINDILDLIEEKREEALKELKSKEIRNDKNV